jgi:hypothetical protein
MGNEITISENTKDKDNTKRMFNFGIRGFLISSALVSSLLAAGCSADAENAIMEEPTKPDQMNEAEIEVDVDDKPLEEPSIEVVSDVEKVSNGVEEQEPPNEESKKPEPKEEPVKQEPTPEPKQEEVKQEHPKEEPVKETPPKEEPPVEEPSIEEDPPKEEKSVAIKTRHGDTYGVNSQAEYDAVMKEVDSVIAKYQGTYKLGDRYHEYYIEYINGARWSGDKSDRSDRNRGLFAAEREIGALVEAGLSQEQIEKAYEASLLAYKAIGGTIGGKNGAPRSAYESIILKVSDCDADAQGISAVMNELGFETKVQYGSADAKPYIKLNGTWYVVFNGSLGW